MLVTYRRYIICIDGSSKRQITKSTLTCIVCTYLKLHCMHNRIGIARLVGFCDAASRLSMASGTAGRSRLVLACLSLVEEDPYDTVSGGTTSRDFSSRPQLLVCTRTSI